jgi:hypothetical protein
MSATKLSDEDLTLIRRFPLAPRNKEQFSEAIALTKELTKPSRLKSLTDGESNYLYSLESQKRENS